MLGLRRNKKKINNLFGTWIKLQEEEIIEIGKTIVEIIERLDLEEDRITERIESKEYLSLLKKCFRDWSAAESEEKRVLIRNLLVNSASSNICSDDVIHQFVQWIDKYSELHFKVIKCIHNQDGITRAGIWSLLNGERVPENSAEADMFKLVIHDLSLGLVIRQHRETD